MSHPVEIPREDNEVQSADSFSCQAVQSNCTARDGTGSYPKSPDGDDSSRHSSRRTSDAEEFDESKHGIVRHMWSLSTRSSFDETAEQPEAETASSEIDSCDEVEAAESASSPLISNEVGTVKKNDEEPVLTGKGPDDENGAACEKALSTVTSIADIAEKHQALESSEFGSDVSEGSETPKEEPVEHERIRVFDNFDNPRTYCCHGHASVWSRTLAGDEVDDLYQFDGSNYCIIHDLEQEMEYFGTPPDSEMAEDLQKFLDIACTYIATLPRFKHLKLFSRANGKDLMRPPFQFVYASGQMRLICLVRAMQQQNLTLMQKIRRISILFEELLPATLVNDCLSVSRTRGISLAAALQNVQILEALKGGGGEL